VCVRRSAWSSISFHVDGEAAWRSRVAPGCSLGQPKRGQRGAGCDRELRFHQIDAETSLGPVCSTLKARMASMKAKRDRAPSRRRSTTDSQGAVGSCSAPATASCLAPRRLPIASHRLATGSRYLDVVSGCAAGSCIRAPTKWLISKSGADDCTSIVPRLANEAFDRNSNRFRRRLCLGTGSVLGFLQL